MTNDKATAKTVTRAFASGPTPATLKIEELEKSKVDELRAAGLKFKSGDTLNYTSFGDPGPWAIHLPDGTLL
jgi:hypothetical protein